MFGKFPLITCCIQQKENNNIKKKKKCSKRLIRKLPKCQQEFTTYQSEHM